jgi:hypothetical protein
MGWSIDAITLSVAANWRRNVVPGRYAAVTNSASFLRVIDLDSSPNVQRRRYSRSCFDAAECGWSLRQYRTLIHWLR